MVERERERERERGREIVHLKDEEFSFENGKGFLLVYLNRKVFAKVCVN